MPGSYVVTEDVSDEPVSSYSPKIATSSRSSQPYLRPKAVPGRASFYVLSNVLSTREKAKYKSISEWEDEEDDDAEEIIEVEGEHVIDGKSYCFARHRDGILRRKETQIFKALYPELYHDFKNRQKNGELSPFDPTSTRIHPAHRVSLRVSIKPRVSNKRNTVARGEEEGYSNASNASSESESSDDAEDDDYISSRPRRSTRSRNKTSSSKKTRSLPYSPKKTKNSRWARTIESDEDEDSDDGKRRSSRNKTRKYYGVKEGSDYELEDDPSDSSVEETIAPVKKKGRTQARRGPKPEYGVIRAIDDLDDTEPGLLRHRDECERCRRPPAHILLQQPAKKKRKKRDSDSESSDEGEAAHKLGGWVRCLKCCVAAHWSCLAATQRAEIKKAIRSRADPDSVDESVKIRDLEVDEATEFLCGACSKGGVCMMCKEVVLQAEHKDEKKEADDVTDLVVDKPNIPQVIQESTMPQEQEILFRCLKCKRLAHYAHLPMDQEGLTTADIAEFYQENNGWQCADCASYVYPLDKIIAWRPIPDLPGDTHPNYTESVNFKNNLPRQYLVKWTGRSYRRTEWVPHMWLVTMNLAKLKNFYENGPRVQLLDLSKTNNLQTPDVGFLGVVDTSRDPSAEPNSKPEVTLEIPPPPLPDAEDRIPGDWKTIDRILDLLVWSPIQNQSAPKKGRRTAKRTIESEDEAPDPSGLPEADFVDGEEPNADLTDTVAEYEDLTGRDLGPKDLNRVAWVFVKWKDLPYDESTWDTPPRPGANGYEDFKLAYDEFLRARNVHVKKKSASEIQKIEDRGGRRRWESSLLGIPDNGVYDIGQDARNKLMPFQTEGVNWLCRNWFHHQHCILADEMGLGKTVQIITFLGILQAKLSIFPSLVVVPNSTITNWVREFAKWAPAIRVVPYYGEMKSREIIKEYELQHSDPAPGTTGAKYHVLVTTYETITNTKDFPSVFKKNPRWEVLVVDEGQRLKNDSNLIFKRLNELNTRHRIIMTGTPLNNNIRELFNLMNFLDPDDWKDLEALSKEFEELDEERVKTLHERLRPYFLRRVKADVLDLPPKNEVIVPLTMTPLQKEIYRSILSKNLSILKSLTESTSVAKFNRKSIKASNLRNMLMHLRKCLQHPYLIADDIEPKGLDPIEAHSKLIDASAKLLFLRSLLPKLKARGHRILLFSQFVIGLDIIEDFLRGEGYSFLRLDGDTKQVQRQKNMDEFNRANSDIFIFILSTRAGGVGINLWSADTVIIFDPDFNPHQDLQAIARAHRYGQTKTCLVFKFMIKDSAEEKIMQAGKKKLVLDHLIVQKMDDVEDAENIQSMLTFGAAALFDETQESHDIKYSEQEIDKLIDKVETEVGEDQTGPSNNNVLSFAKVWSSHNDELDELVETENRDQIDSWALALQKISENHEAGKVKEVSGRGVRRKATKKVKYSYFEEGSPDKVAKRNFKKRKVDSSEDSGDEYNAPSRNQSEEPTSSSSVVNDDMELHGPVNSIGVPKKPTLSEIPILPEQMKKSVIGEAAASYCGLCNQNHATGNCPMTQEIGNLLEYRRMLIENEDEPFDTRIRAIRAIDEALRKQSTLHLANTQLIGLASKNTGPNRLGVDVAGSSHHDTWKTQHLGQFSARQAYPMRQSGPLPPSQPQPSTSFKAPALVNRNGSFSNTLNGQYVARQGDRKGP